MNKFLPPFKQSQYGVVWSINLYKFIHTCIEQIKDACNFEILNELYDT